MGARNLRQFLKALKANDELIFIDEPCESYLEIPEIYRRVIAANGPALFFRNVKGSPFPLVINQYGTQKRVQLAFGQEPGEFISRVCSLLHQITEPDTAMLKEAGSLIFKALKIGSRRVRRAPVLQKKCKPDFTSLPAVHCWEKDGGHFLTLPQVLSKSPVNDKTNLGIYRMQIFDSCTTGMHFQIGKGGGFHLNEAEKIGVKLPIQVSLGGPPALTLAAILPLPEGISEILMASILMGERVTTCSSPHTPLPIFAESEFTFLGHCPPGTRREEGPFGDHYGYYSLAHPFPIFQAKVMYRRKKPIFPAMVVGKPRQEDYYLGNYLQELLSPIFPLVMPGIISLWSYGETGFHSLSAAIVKERYEREALVSGFRILGEGQLSLSKFLLLTTERSINLKNFKEVLTHVLERFDPENDLYILPDLSMDTLDYCGPRINRGSKGIMLGSGEIIRKLPLKFNSKILPGYLKMAKVFSPGCLVVEGNTYSKDSLLPKKLAASKLFNQWPLVILCDDCSLATSSTTAFLWTTFTRFEPQADIFNAGEKITRNKISRKLPIIIDARKKRNLPDELFCDQKTAKKVEKKWHKYFPEKNVEMGSKNPLYDLSPE
ncbi:UbiD family decarboxylase [Candidatus Riflebacteria bacterium]